MSKTLYYNQSYLQTDSPQCNSNQYFKEISYTVNLEDIYKLVKTCCYYDLMQYVPVLLEVIPEQIRMQYGGCKYLLQVYDKTYKTKIFEKALECIFV